MEKHPYSLYENLTKLSNHDNLFIFDFFHLTTNQEEEFIMKYISIIKEYCYITNLNIIYLIFVKPNISDENSKVSKVLIDLTSQNKNIYIEDKLINIHFITGFSAAKALPTYIFCDESTKSSKWLKNINFEMNFSEFEFVKITIENMKKTLNPKDKPLSKLTMLLSDKVPSKDTKVAKKEDQINVNDTNVKHFHKFQTVFNNIVKYMLNNPPKSFKTIKNIICNYAEQNSDLFFKNFSLKEENLAFMLFSELMMRDILINEKLKMLIKDKIITNLDEIDSLLNFFLNPDIEESNLMQENLNLFSENEKEIKNKKSNRKKNDQINFSISENSHEEYKNLLLNCEPICHYVKNIIYKILSKLGITSIDKLPTNPSKYKNLIYSYVNNQELLKISKKIFHLNYEKVVNILTEGIIIELMNNNLIVFISDKKIHYNIVEIEREKFRLAQMNLI